MSGLEALAIFGIAVNVFSTISFAGELYKICKNISTAGNPDPDLANNLDNLNRAFEDIEAAIRQPPRPLSANDNALLDILKECKAATSKIKEEVDKITSSKGKGKVLRTIIKGIRYTTLKNVVEEGEKTLQRHRSTLETRLLFSVFTKNDAIKVTQEKGFNTLDSELQKVMTKVASGESALTVTLIEGFRSTNQNIMNIGDQIAKLQRALDQDKQDERHKMQHQKLLDSLKYGSMNERRNQIQQPASTTFQWVFEGGGNEQGELHQDDEDHEDHEDDKDDQDDQDNEDDQVFIAESVMERYARNIHMRARAEVSARFVRWLQSPDQHLFWITGKPGSGKSTLMKFLATHPKTKKNVEALGENPQVLSHFIWKAGQPMERKIKGLLCSLLHQLMGSFPENTPRILQKFPKLSEMGSHADWSETDLEDTFKFAVGLSDKPIMIFIDGLDEIDRGLSDGAMKLIGLVQEVQALSSVKLCVSSRAETIFKRHLSHAPSFAIHDVTAEDIERFAISVTHKRFYLLPMSNKRDLAHKVCDMAEGVFLWVALALRSLEIGLQHGDNITDLEERLSTFPPELEDLYRDMWKRSGASERIYRKHAAKYFNIVLEAEEFGRPLRVAELLLAMDPTLIDRFQNGNLSTTLDTLADIWKSQKNSMEVHCLGLLETHNGSNPLTDTVSFVHRSAQEFLKHTEEGQRLLQADCTPKGQRVLALHKAILVHVAERLKPVWTSNLSHYLSQLDMHLDKGIISQSQMVDIASLVEYILESFNPAKELPWRRAPWVDLLGIAVCSGSRVLVQERLAQLDGSARGPVSTAYNSYLLTALFTAQYVLTKPWLLEAVELFMNREIDVKSRSLAFLENNLFTDMNAEAFHITPLEAVLHYILIRNFNEMQYTVLAELLLRLLDLGPDLSGHTVLTASHSGRDSNSGEHTWIIEVGFGALLTPLRNPADCDVLIETDIGTLLSTIAACRLERPGLQSNPSVRTLVARINSSRAEYRLRGSVWDQDGNCFEPGEQFNSRLAMCLEGMRMANTRYTRSFEIPGLYDLACRFKDDSFLVEEDKILSRLVAEDILWEWDDERTFRPSPYATMPEPREDLSLSLH